MPKKTKSSPSKRNEYFWGWFFISPLTIGFLLFTLVPLALAIFYSFTEYDLFHAPQWIGFDNFIKVFQDEFFGKSLLNALVYAIGVPVGAFIALILSSMLVNISRGSLVYRMIYYLPTICGSVAITFIWQWMYAPTYGILHTFMKSIGMQPIKFLSSKYFLGSMMVMGVWSGMGVSVLLFYSSLHNISRSLYDAASLDGANGIQKFYYVTLPGISSVLFYILITGILGSLQTFTSFQVISNDYVNLNNVMPVWWIYKFTGTYGYKYGYASALGVIFGLILILISAIQFVVSKYWVKYDS